MFDAHHPPHTRYQDLPSHARALVDAVADSELLVLPDKKMQIQIATASGKPIGGINPVHNHLYLLSSYVAGRLSGARLNELGFSPAQRSGDNGYYWKKPGISDVEPLRVAIEDATGQPI